MVAWRDDFGMIEGGHSNIYFVNIGSTHESQRAAALSAKRADTPGPFDFNRFSFCKLKVVPGERSPSGKRRASTLATIFAMAMSHVAGLAGAFVSNSTAQATAADYPWLCSHH
jgi:hypothetical protein